MYRWNRPRAHIYICMSRLCGRDFSAIYIRRQKWLTAINMHAYHEKLLFFFSSFFLQFMCLKKKSAIFLIVIISLAPTDIFLNVHLLIWSCWEHSFKMHLKVTKCRSFFLNSYFDWDKIATTKKETQKHRSIDYLSVNILTFNNFGKLLQSFCIKIPFT